MYINAENANGLSVDSREVTVRTPARSTGSAPGAPVNIHDEIEFRTHSTLRLAWDQNDNGGSSVSEWEVTVMQDGNILEVDTVFERQYLANRLEPGTTYEFTVKAINRRGTSAASEAYVVDFATFPDVPPAPNTSIDGSEVTVTYKLVQDDRSGAEITDYIIEIRTRFNDWEQTADCRHNNERTCVVDVHELMQRPFILQVGDLVQARVAAVNSVGKSSYSGVGGDAIVATEPDAPSRIGVFVGELLEKAVVHFQQPENNGGSEVTSYRYFVKENYFAADHQDVLDASHYHELVGSDYEQLEAGDHINDAGETITVEDDHNIRIQLRTLFHEPWNLQIGSQICIRIKSVNMVGESEFSSPACVTFPEVCLEEVPPGVPSDFEITDLSAQSVTLAWNEHRCDGNSPILAHILFWIDENDQEGFLEVEGAENVMTTDVFEPTKEYAVMIVSVNEYGASMPMDYVRMTVPSAAPEAPLDVQADNTDKLVHLSWTAPEDYNTPIERYIIRWQEYDERDGAFIE